MGRRAATSLAWLWALSFVIVWVTVALTLHHDLLAAQSSQALVAFGAIKGGDLTVRSAWCLVPAQWLHVHFAHMLLNAAIIAIVGTAVERRTSPPAMLLIGLIGGTAGAWTSAIVDADGFVSGASQAYLALCGAAVILLGRRSTGWWIAVAATLIAIALDIHASSTIKAGHIAGFAVGVACGTLLTNRQRRVRR